MASNSWRATTLGAEAEILTGFPFKSAAYTKESNGIPLIRGDNIIQGQLRWDGVKRWSASETREVSNYFLKAGDVVLAMDRPWIEAGLKYAALSENDLPCLLVQRVARLRAKEKLDQGFLKYIVGSLQFTNHVLGSQTGTAVPHISGNQIREYRFLCPPLAAQRAIAHVLGTLDDKIALNRRMNETLEALARALFNSWFVGFDPVRARAEGRAPEGIDAEMAALFPDSFENSELGMIPKGWEVGRLDDLLVLQRGFDLPAASRIPGSYPILSASGLSGTHIEYKVKGPGVTTGRSGLLGKVFFVHENFWPLNTSLWVKEFRRARPIYAFHLLRDLDFDTFNAGSAVPTLNRNHVHNLRVLIPPLKVVEMFEAISVPMFRRCYQSSQESLVLASIRDALLPKLISGEVRVEL